MLSYPIRSVPTDDGRVLICFPDVPEADALGATEEEAVGKALGVLEAVLTSYCVDGRPIPAPSDICGAPLVTTDKFSIVGMDLG